MSNTSSLQFSFSRLSELARLYEKNLANYDFIIFYKKGRNIRSFKAPIYDYNFAHLVGLAPTQELRYTLRRLRKHTKPSVVIYESFLKNNTDILNWIKPTRSMELTEKKIASAEQIFKFPILENIYFADEHLKEINIFSDKFVNRLNYSLGFAFDDDLGEYYVETNLNRDKKQRILKPLDIYAVIRSKELFNYEITMYKGDRLTTEDKRQIVGEFIFHEDLLSLDKQFFSKIKFLENDLYLKYFKDSWVCILNLNGIEQSNDKVIANSQPSLEDEIESARESSQQMNMKRTYEKRVEVKRSKDEQNL